MDNSSTLIRFDGNGLELVINTQTGECYASQSAVARMCNVSRQSIIKWIGSRQIEMKKAEILTPGGLQGCTLLNEEAIYHALGKYNPTLLVQCAKAGLRLYLNL